MVRPHHALGWTTFDHMKSPGKALRVVLADDHHFFREGLRGVLVEDDIGEPIEADKTMDAGFCVAMIDDRGELVEITTHTVLHNMLEGMILVAVVLFLFLGHTRAALITALDERGELTVRHQLPFSTLDLPDAERQRSYGTGPIEYSHSLAEQIGGQLAAGFTLTHLDEAPHHAYALVTGFDSEVAPACEVEGVVLLVDRPRYSLVEKREGSLDRSHVDGQVGAIEDQDLAIEQGHPRRGHRQTVGRGGHDVRQANQLKKSEC